MRYAALHSHAEAAVSIARAPTSKVGSSTGAKRGEWLLGMLRTVPSGLYTTSNSSTTWTIPLNRELIVRNGLVTVWLESSFEHCWANISKSRKERPLAKNKIAARRLFDERQSIYCLADWHFVIRPEFNSYEIARQIADQVFS